jgi:hypothetical protein
LLNPALTLATPSEKRACRLYERLTQAQQDIVGTPAWIWLDFALDVKGVDTDPGLMTQMRQEFDFEQTWSNWTAESRALFLFGFAFNRDHGGYFESVMSKTGPEALDLDCDIAGIGSMGTLVALSQYDWHFWDYLKKRREAGLPMGKPDTDGNTPLHLALWSGNTDAARFLLALGEAGEDVGVLVQNSKGELPGKTMPAMDEQRALKARLTRLQDIARTQNVLEAALPAGQPVRTRSVL